MRELICDALRETNDLQVVGTAVDGRQALEAFRKTQPDLITLDIQMPGLDGLATLEALLKIAPVPVIVVSALTRLGAESTFRALELGALDYVGKPAGAAQFTKVWKEELVRKIRTMAGSDVEHLLKIRRERAQRKALQKSSAAAVGANAVVVPGASLRYLHGCIALGISTGGPPALSSLFESLSGQLPPMVVVQHMPADFTRPLAERLNGLSTLTIKEAASGDRLQSNCVYIAPGGMHLSLVKSGSIVRCSVQPGEVVSGHKPSVDVLMQSAAQVYGPKCLGVIMTGMGRDGVAGCREIRAAGGYVLGQDEASSDVYGMNKLAFTAGNVDEQFSLENAAAVITQQAKLLGKAASLCSSSTAS